MDFVVFTSRLSTTLDDDVEVSLASAEIDALIPSRNCFVPCAEMEEVKPYCSSKLLDLSVSILVSITSTIYLLVTFLLLASIKVS